MSPVSNTQTYVPPGGYQYQGQEMYAPQHQQGMPNPPQNQVPNQGYPLQNQAPVMGFQAQPAGQHEMYAPHEYQPAPTQPPPQPQQGGRLYGGPPQGYVNEAETRANVHEM